MSHLRYFSVVLYIIFAFIYNSFCIGEQVLSKLIFEFYTYGTKNTIGPLGFPLPPSAIDLNTAFKIDFKAIPRFSLPLPFQHYVTKVYFHLFCLTRTNFVFGQVLYLLSTSD